MGMAFFRLSFGFCLRGDAAPARDEVCHAGEIPELPLIAVSSEARFEGAINPRTAPLFLIELLLQFTDQLEQIGELVIVVIGWFGIRGIGSFYYLAYAVQHGLPQSRTDSVANTVLGPSPSQSRCMESQ